MTGSPLSRSPDGDRTFMVLVTPGPPDIGTPRQERVVAASADAAVAKVEATQNWCMIHKVTEVSGDA